MLRPKYLTRIIFSLIAIGMGISPAIYACTLAPPPFQLVKTPEAPWGEWVPSPSASFEEQVQNTFETYPDLAIISLLSDQVIGEYWVAKIELIYGWGYQSGRELIYTRSLLDSCGAPSGYEVGRYLAVLSDGEILNIAYDYEEIEPFLLLLGEPRYQYSNLGLKINEDND
mgnify:CR=1 FL=1